MAVNDNMVNRINELYRLSKERVLTSEEKTEQASLRNEYIISVKNNLRGQLNQINIQEKDGTVTNLFKKYGTKDSK